MPSYLLFTFRCLISGIFVIAYTDFTLIRVKEELGLIVKEGQSLFEAIAPVEAAAYLKESLKRSKSFATLVNTEKVRLEFLIAPILGEVRSQMSEKLEPLFLSLTNANCFNQAGEIKRGGSEFFALDCEA